MTRPEVAERVCRTRLSRPQSRVFLSMARFRVLVAGRRFGKTFLAIAELIREATSKPDRECWYIGPTYRQAKMIAWEALKKAVPPEARKSTNEQELTLVLLNGSTISLKGADNPESLRGLGLHLVILDEYADMSADVWSVIVRPMLADTNGRALFIGTPKGFNHLYDLFMNSLTKLNWEGFQFTTLEGGNVAAAEIEEAKRDMDGRQFAQEFLASFENMTGKVYHAFDRTLDTGNVRYLTDLGGDLSMGIDFNVNPMSIIIAQRNANTCEFIKEFIVPNSNTTEMMQVVRNCYPGRRVTAFPDPTGNARKTNAAVGETDFTIIRKFGFQIWAPSRPYLIVDRVNTVNALLCNAEGVRRCFVDPRNCPILMKSFDGLAQKKGTNLPDKESGLDHPTDAAGYYIMGAFPLKPFNEVQKRELVF